MNEAEVKRERDRNPNGSRPSEIAVLDRCIREIRPAKTYLEIGSYLGSSLRRFSVCMESDARLVGVDRPIQRDGIEGKLLAMVDALNADTYTCKVFLGNSRDPDIVKQVHAECPVVDVLFIDGEHTETGVNADAENYVPLVRQGGLVMFHDVGPCEWSNPRAGDVIKACFGAWKTLADKNTNKLIVQSNAGYGLVWID